MLELRGATFSERLPKRRNSLPNNDVMEFRVRGHTLSQSKIGMPGDSKARDRLENPEAKEAREAKAGVCQRCNSHLWEP